MRVLLLAALLVSPSLFAQNPGSAQRDPQALTVVQAAIIALGGAQAISQVRNVSIQAQVQGSESNPSGTVTWLKEGNEFRLESNTNSGSSYIVSGHGKPARVEGGRAKSLPPHAANAQFVLPLVGSVLLSQSQDQTYSVEYAGTTTLGVQSVAVVKTSFQKTQTEALVTPQTWYFDSTTGLPVRVEYRLPGLAGPKLFVPAVADLSDYRSVSGALYPFHITTYHRGTQAAVYTIQTISTNTGISASQFDAPLGGGR